MAVCKGCQNLVMKVEGKGFLKSGEWKCYCRARNNAPLDYGTVKRMCVDINPDALMDQVNRQKDQRYVGKGEPCWKQCNYSRFFYG